MAIKVFITVIGILFLLGCYEGSETVRRRNLKLYEACSYVCEEHAGFCYWTWDRRACVCEDGSIIRPVDKPK